VAIMTLVVVALAAAIASAIPPLSRSSDPKVEPVGTVSLGSRAPQPRLETATRPDHSACQALVGLENAGCRVQANLEAHPNPGLANAIQRLEANVAAHAAGLSDVRRPGVDLEPGGLGVAAAHGAPVASP
jgi:hypothetical protein